jgi:integrase/recombinase XerD
MLEAAMCKSKRLRRWDATVCAYLANRHAFGRRYFSEEWMLGTLRRFLAAKRAEDLDQRLFDQWRKTLGHLSPNTQRGREMAVYKLCRFRRRSEPHCFLPDPLSFARARPYPPRVLFEPAQIAELLRLASKLPSRRSPLRPHVVRLAIVLLYTAGLRRGEVVRLRMHDVDLGSGVLHIRESKFHKSRWVPLSSSARVELQRYIALRQKIHSGACPTAPLLSNGWRDLSGCSGGGLGQSIRRLILAANIRDASGRHPCVHSMRHSFAVAALLRWYEAGADVQSCLPKLALYMGHVSIVSTAYYLKQMPAVVTRASERFARAYAAIVSEGAS